MATKKDNPAVVVPPPLIYVAVFFLSLMLQKYFPINNSFFTSGSSKITGLVLMAIALLFILPALLKFAQSKNTLMTIRPANSLQTNGIYKISRNPMYAGLIFLYSGIGMLKGNWWTFILIPVIIIIVQLYVIKGEENYLQRAFGEAYIQYRKKVRRWI
ncbi:isoprenylcysteine carboxylmethyltransferase family protein [Panacibacter ginsenosidivorans]|uniref:Isoprenylcysteine carboxylmethyltransferase family protein n=1 Tax=Panacibacter ginsenosidivorans TaxID=1813871 RepID=A0A5B8VCM5_9BACT|nr:isoprenylcysteine carboxylmethyltransferase family protein [Panacibacter ginsenosidivorans]QEC68436.1 isoprenylcysteine carboxylmethyltransferase family protein [Panacibacter ginsenosidivorans]